MNRKSIIKLSLIVVLSLMLCQGCSRIKTSIIGFADENLKGKSLVYIYIPSNDDHYIKNEHYRLFANGNELGLISKGSYYAYISSPGKQDIYTKKLLHAEDYALTMILSGGIGLLVETAKVTELEISTEANNVYYLQLKWKAFSGRQLMQVDYPTGSTEIKDCKPVESEDKEKSQK